LTKDQYCKVTIVASFDRYVLNDNSKSNTLDVMINEKYIQIIEDIVHRLKMMDDVSST